MKLNPKLRGFLRHLRVALSHQLITRKQVLYDALTGLPNRIFFVEWHYSRTPSIGQGKHRHVAFAIVDLDRFKQLNDTYGHVIGNRVLASVAERFRQVLCPGEFATRFGGDEFVLVLTNQSDNPHAYYARLSEISWEMTREPHRIDGMEFRQNMSIGYCLQSRPDEDYRDVLHRADLAMYRAKRGGNDIYQPLRLIRYHPSMLAQSQAEKQLSADLRRAVSEGELSVGYMPIVDLETELPVGFESLYFPEIDWPGDYDAERAIEILDETGQLAELLELQLSQACRNVVYWSLIAGYELVISINVTASQVESGNLIELVEAALERHPVGGHQLAFEVTEGQRVYEPTIFVRALQELRVLGCQLVMDDFGREHSDWTRLYQHDYWTDVKLDKPFAQRLLDERGFAITASIVEGLKRAGARVTAEWTETPEQAEAAYKAGCDRAQGELYSSTDTHMREAEVIAYLDRTGWARASIM